MPRLFGRHRAPTREQQNKVAMFDALCELVATSDFSYGDGRAGEARVQDENRVYVGRAIAAVGMALVDSDLTHRHVFDLTCELAGVSTPRNQVT
jgi:hypothetical protein